MAGIGDPLDEEGEAPGLLQSFGHMLGQTGVGPVDLTPGVGSGHIAVKGVKPQGLMAAGSGASMPRGIAAPVPAPPPTPKIVAYHGTPHDFDQFDIGKIGTGEGAQVYGHGLYFAESPGVAASYRDNLGRPSVRIDGRDIQPVPGSPEDIALAHLETPVANKSSDPFAAAIQSVRLAGQNASPSLKDKFVAAEYALNDWKALGASPSKVGHLYQVEINADPSHFLDWDKPLSEQSPEVRAALHKVGVGPASLDTSGLAKYGDWGAAQAQYINDLAAKKGSDIYQSLAGPSLTPGPAASEALHAAGIPGIRYLDQGSRINRTAEAIEKDIAFNKQYREFTPDGRRRAPALVADIDEHTQRLQDELKRAQNPSRNYVVFDDKHVNITHKNGVKVTPVEHEPEFEERASGGIVQLSDYRGKLTPVEYDPFAEAA